ncbi:MAG: PAS domain S-box protein [Chloroflexi bacterium]|nr:PAS domain S-box protein [Chloroflexota bacterium]
MVASKSNQQPLVAAAPSAGSSEDALRLAEEKYRAIVDSAVGGIITIDEHGIIESLNPAAERLFGYRADEVVGRKVNVLMAAPYSQEHDSYLNSYLTTGVKKIIGIGREVTGRRQDGATFPMHLAVSETRLGPRRMFTAVIIDLSERKRVEEQLRQSEERLRLALDAAGMGTWEWDVRSGEVRWSESLELIHGLSPGTFGGTFEAYRDDIHAEDRDHVLQEITRSLERGSHDVDYRIIRPDGTVRWVAGKGRAVRDASGAVVGMIGVCMDITERKQVEEERDQILAREQAARAEAEAGQNRLAFLAEAGGLLTAASLDSSMALAGLAHLAVPFLGDWCAIDMLDEDNSIRRVAVVHRDPAKVELARRLEERYPFDPKASFGVPNILRTGAAELYPEIGSPLVEAFAQDAEHLNVIRELGLKSAMCVPLVARGRTIGVISVVSAESGRLYSEADLALAEELARRAGLAVDNARLYEELRKANEAKDEFLGIVSHELRSPLTAIYGGARMLRFRGDRLDEPTRAGILDDIEQESDRLFRMVENLLALARTELAGEVKIEPVLLQRVIEKMAATFRQRRPRRRLHVLTDGDLEPVAALPTYVELVLRNLLSNADKYSPPDSRIIVRARRGAGQAEVSVLDRGPGVSPEEAPLIFERFYRSDQASRRAGGVGMGLTVCKRLIEAQAGRVWARRRRRGGLEVGFALPFYGQDSP